MSPHPVDMEKRASVRVPRNLRSSHHLAEAAAVLAHGFKSEIDLRAGEICIDAKSTGMAQAFLEVLRGRTLELVVWGEDSGPALRSLAALFKTAATILLLLAAPSLLAASAPPSAAEADPFDARVNEADALGRKGLAILPYYPTYILPLSYQTNPNQRVFASEYGGKSEQNVEIKYQISLRFPLWLDIADRGINLYAAYTQLSFWQAYNDSDSSPFRDTTYEPELMTVVPWRFSLGPLTNHSVHFGFVHQSNGRASGEFDRSWNRIYARMVTTSGPLVLAIRAWYKLSNGMGNNQDIADYYGYGDLMARLHLGRHTLSLTFRNNMHTSDNRGAVELGWTHPLIYGTRWYIQYWNGYGESLVDYNHSSQRIGVGILLGEWL